MARLHLVHWDPAAGHSRRQDLASLGHDVAFTPLDGTPLLRALRASPPDAFVIDLSRSPAKGREVAQALRRSPATRRVPLLFVDGEPDKVSRVRELLPDAAFAAWAGVADALPRALAQTLAAPVVRRDATYGARTVAQKLGIKAGQVVALLGGPPGAADLLGPLPDGARFIARVTPAAALLVWFVRSADDLQRGLARLAVDTGDRVLWMVWRKQTAATAAGTTSVNGNHVREAGLAAGLVDFKICAVDATWSAMAFKRRPASSRG